MVPSNQELQCPGLVSSGIHPPPSATRLTAPPRADDAMTDVIFNTGSILFPIG